MPSFTEYAFGRTSAILSASGMLGKPLHTKPYLSVTAITECITASSLYLQA